MGDSEGESSILSSTPPTASRPQIKQQDYKSRISEYSRNIGKDNISHGELHASSTAEESTEISETDDLVQRLALQSYHLTGNNCLQDWWQFIFNNHPVFGICCHNAAHPIKAYTRIVALIGTITFGLAITSAFYVFFAWNPEFNRVLASLVTDNGTEFVLSTGMLLLWTIGGGIHCIFNLAMWHIAACACCQSGGCCESYACCPSLGKKMIRFFVLCIFGFCVLIIILRVAVNDQEQKEIDAEIEETKQGGINIMFDDQLDLRIASASDLSFVVNYLVEMTLAFFVYYPIGATMLFSGILSCGYNIPLLGGRPYEIACEERRKLRQQEGVSARKTSNNV